MNRTFLILAALMAGVLCIHLFAGGAEYAAQYRTELSDPKLASMAMVLWHAVSVCLALLAGVYFWVAFRPNPVLVHVTSLMQLGWAALFLIYGLSWMGEIVTMPQWVLFVGFPLAATYVVMRQQEM